MILELNSKIKLIIYLFLLCHASIAFADPEVNNELIPPGEAMYVTDSEVLNKLNLGPDGEPIWCYSNLANSLIISSADREKEKCQLMLQQQKQLDNVNCNFLLDQLKIEIQSLNTKHEEILGLKNKQIDNLTEAALKTPNDYSLWWASGGVAVGVLTTLAIFFAVSQ